MQKHQVSYIKIQGKHLHFSHLEMDLGWEGNESLNLNLINEESKNRTELFLL
jgi:hypothetical protein